MFFTKKDNIIIIQNLGDWYTFKFTNETAAAIEIWIAALLSGTYTQGKYKLHNLQSDSYCCLGVLRKVFPYATQNREAILEEDFNNCLNIIENANIQKFFIRLNDYFEYTFSQIAMILENIVRFIKSNDENMEINVYVR